VTLNTPFGGILCLLITISLRTNFEMPSYTFLKDLGLQIKKMVT